MHRFRILLQGPFAACVVVWAGLLGSVNMVPGAAWSPAGPVVDRAPGDDLQAPPSLLVQPLIADVPGVGGKPEVPEARTHEDPDETRAFRTGLHPTTPLRVARAAVRDSPNGRRAMSGAHRYQWFCTYRL